MQTTALQPYQLMSVTVENNIGIKFNVLPQVIDAVIQQDIYSDGMYGHLTISDGLGLVEALSFHGDELITIDVQDNIENKKHTFSFISYAVSPKIVKDNLFQSIYTINFCSAELLVNASTVSVEPFPTALDDLELCILSFWRNTFPASFKNFLLGKEGEKVSPSVVVQTTTQNPYSVIRNLLKYCKNKNGAVDYLLFENFEGYNLISTSELASAAPICSYYFGKKENTSAAGNYFNMIDYQETETHDSVRDLISGVYASTIYSHETVLKKWAVHRINYADYFADSKNVANGGVLNKASSEKYGSTAGNIKIVPQKKYLVEGQDVFDSDAGAAYPVEGLAIGKYTHSIKKLLYGPKLNVLVHGNLLINVGKLLNINPATVGVNKEFTANKLMSGTFMVTAVAHVFTLNSYYTHAETSKNGFNIELPGFPMVKTKTEQEKNKEEKITSLQDERNVVAPPKKVPISTRSFPSSSGGSGGGSGGGGGGGNGGSGGGASSGGATGAIPDAGAPVVNPVPVPVDTSAIRPTNDTPTTDSINNEAVQSSNSYQLLINIREQDRRLSFSDEFDAVSSHEDREELLRTMINRQKVDTPLLEHIKKRKEQIRCE